MSLPIKTYSVVHIDILLFKKPSKYLMTIYLHILILITKNNYTIICIIIIIV